MGIDLKVLTSHFRERRGEFLSTATLLFERDPRLFAQLAPTAQPSLVHPLPAGLKAGHYADQGLTFVEIDGYGQPLTFTTTSAIRTLRLPEDLSPWNRAVLTFLQALPLDARLILYWC